MLKQWCRFVLPVAVLAAALGVYRLAVGAAGKPEKLSGRDTPWVIAPQQNEPLVASDEELIKVLTRMQPAGKPAATNIFVHALRMWGPNVKFDKAQSPSGEQLRNYFLDDRVFREMAGYKAPPIFAKTQDGLYRARFFDDSTNFRTTSSYHTDDLLATFAETGTPLDAKVTLRDGEQTTVRELSENALQDFNLSRHEFEWSIIAYARYTFPRKYWKNKFGEVITVDDLVDKLVDAPCGVGPCNGLHRLEALVVLYRADEMAKVLSPKTREKMLKHMRRVSEMLVQAQTDEGSWNRNWKDGAKGRTDAKATVYDKLLVTGHHLEWLALAPQEVQPPRETVVRAARWTLKTVLEISDAELQEHYGPFSHAARALCLWRGHEPGEVWATRPVAIQSQN